MTVQRSELVHRKAASFTKSVHAKIQQMEETYGIKVIFAAEHSSHVWGTAHKESDWDIKIVFSYSIDRYFSPREMPSHIKQVFGPRESVIIKGAGKEGASIAAGQTQSPRKPENLDVEISGWDVVHFSKLVKNGDATVMEILFSPVVYVDVGRPGHPQVSVMDEVRNISESFSPPYKLAQHNYRLAKSLMSMMRERKGRFANLEPGKKETKNMGYILRNLLSALVLLHCDRVADTPLHWAELCSVLQRLAPSDPQADPGSKRLTTHEIDRFRTFFSRFANPSKSFELSPVERAECLDLAHLVLERAESALQKGRSDTLPKGTVQPPNTQCEQRLAAWALTVASSTSPPGPGRQRAQRWEVPVGELLPSVAALSCVAVGISFAVAAQVLWRVAGR